MGDCARRLLSRTKAAWIVTLTKRVALDACDGRARMGLGRVDGSALWRARKHLIVFHPETIGRQTDGPTGMMMKSRSSARWRDTRGFCPVTPAGPPSTSTCVSNGRSVMKSGT